MLPIKFSVKYTEKDLSKAYRIYFVRRKPIRTLFSFLLVLMVGMLGVYLFTITIPGTPYRYLSVFFMLYSFLILLIYLYRLNFYGRVIYGKMPEFRESYDYQVSDEGIKVDSALINSFYDWKHFSHAIVTRDIVLLFPNSLRFHFFLSKSFSSNDQFDQFCLLVHEKVKKN